MKFAINIEQHGGWAESMTVTQVHEMRERSWLSVLATRRLQMIGL
jgi:hypothetical protein